MAAKKSRKLAISEKLVTINVFDIYKDHKLFVRTWYIDIPN